MLVTGHLAHWTTEDTAISAGWDRVLSSASTGEKLLTTILQSEVLVEGFRAWFNSKEMGFLHRQKRRVRWSNESEVESSPPNYNLQYPNLFPNHPLPYTHHLHTLGNAL